MRTSEIGCLKIVNMAHVVFSLVLYNIDVGIFL